MVKSESIGQSHKFFHIATRLAGGSVLALMLFACGQDQTTTQPKVIEATLTINTVTERFTQGNSVDLKIEVSSPTETIVNVGLSAPPEVHLEQTQIQVSLAAGEKKGS